MGIAIPTLTQALAAIGNANVYLTQDFAAGEWWELGAKEGPIEANVSYSQNNLTAPELTGGIVHQQLTQLDSVTITVPLIADENLQGQFIDFSPVGIPGGGWSSFQSPDEFTVAIIPNKEVGELGLTYDGTWSPAAPKAAFWLWRATVMHGPISYRFDEGGKIIIDVTFTGMFYGPNPEGHKVFTIGNPIAAGITTLRINAES